MGQPVGEGSVVGQQEGALGADIQAAHGPYPGVLIDQIEDGSAPFGVMGGGDDTLRLIHQEIDQPGLERDVQAINFNFVFRWIDLVT
jgi:hypothetical protein